MLFLLIVGFVLFFMVGMAIYYAKVASQTPKNKMPRKKSDYF